MNKLSKERGKITDLGCVTSKEFKSFARKFKNRMQKQLAEINGTNLEQNSGHYFLSGFFDLKGRTYYYSIPDVRHEPDGKLLIRRAKNHKDYTGETNNFIELSDTMLKDYFN